MEVDEQNNDILDNLINEHKQKKELQPLDVLKELFNKKELETKTDLNIKQIILINKKRAIAEALDFKELSECIDDFLLLSISKDRQGRKEFVEAFKGERENQIQQKQGGLISNIRDRFG